MIIFIIWLLGYIASSAFIFKCFIDGSSKITLIELLFTILVSIFSWITFVLMVTLCYQDLVIYEKKNSDESKSNSNW